MVQGRHLEYDIEKEADELLQWSLQDDALRLYAFVDKKPYAYSKLADFSNRSSYFREALEKAKNRIALRREDLVNHGMIAQCVYTRTHHIYDSAGVEADDNEKDKDLARDLKRLEKEIELKTKSGATQDEIDTLNEAFGLVSQLQDLKRKMDNSSIKAEEKS